jgi:hypothetical protein
MAALFAIFAMIITVLVFLGIALLPAACIYVGWNYGVLAAFPDASLGALTFWQAFAFGLGISILGRALWRKG